MEAASTVRLPAQMRARRAERELNRLRPLGEAYVLRRFGGSLGRADAEDAVSEVVIRLHRRLAEGRAPENLRAAFFTSVRNAAIDQLRWRSSRPTVALDAAYDAPSDRGLPAELAEDREDAVRLQEALGRMRDNYREAIVLRFGLGLTVPEIARHLKISLPAAKKLVLRATKQVRLRLQAIEGAEFCPEMRELARQSLFEKHVNGLASEAEAEILRAHFSHCGSCRAFLASLHDDLYELGSTALLGVAVSSHLHGIGLVDRAAQWVDGLGNGARAGVWKLRHAALKVSGIAPSGDGAASGALVGTGQKIVAVCTAGAAATATCVATGIVGPGITAPPILPSKPHSSHSAQIRTVAPPPPTTPLIRPVVAPPVATSPVVHAKSQTHSAKSKLSKRARSRAQSAASESSAPRQTEEFSFEGAGSAAPAPAPAASQATSSGSASQPSTQPSSGGGTGGSGGGSSGGGGSGGGGGETFGFGG
ncbi:MAG: sigma-70 family RNA polymerase sigma factor [Solirubrobacterales bacterium]